MSLPIFFKPAAEAELVEAIEWYEPERPGLGRDFHLEFESAIIRAQAHHGLYARVRGRARKIQMRRLDKYTIYFAIKDDTFMVLAVFHGARNPSELGKRLR